MPHRKEKQIPKSLFSPGRSPVRQPQAPQFNLASHGTPRQQCPEFCSPVTASAATHAALSDKKGLAGQEKVLVAKHVTNTGAVVRLVETQHSAAMRRYSVYCEEHAVRPFFRLVTVNDIMLLAITIMFLLSCIVSLPSHRAATRLPEWLQRAATHSDAVNAKKQLEATVSPNIRLALSIVGSLLLVFRFFRAYQRVYVEEVLAIRGVGFQITNYGVFNQVRARRFVDLKMIRTLVIHDAYFRYQPIFFLSSSVENNASRLVFFEHTLPRLEVLQKVLVGVRHILYGEEEDAMTMAEREAAAGRLRLSFMMNDDDDSSKGEECGSGDETMSGSREMNYSQASAPDDRDVYELYAA